MTSYEESAIIGYWRSGATVLEISNITMFDIREITITIKQYVSAIHEEIIPDQIKVRKQNKKLQWKVV